MKNVSDEYEKRIESFVSFVLKDYFGRRDRLSKELLSQIHDEINRLVEAERVHDKAFKEKLKAALDRSYEIICKPEVLEKIKSSQITREDFIAMYMHEICGLQKRKYDMKDLYRDDMISRACKTSDKKKVGFFSKPSKVAHQYYDKFGRLVIFSSIGSLAYEEWNGVNASLNAYKVKRENEDGTFSEYTVLSNIIIPEMENEDYKDAVLNELLSEENITLSNCAGYIGKIEKRKYQNDSIDTVGSQITSPSGYQYRINEKYVLSYNPTEVSASIDFENSRREYTLNKDEETSR